MAHGDECRELWRTGKRLVVVFAMMWFKEGSQLMVFKLR